MKKVVLLAIVLISSLSLSSQSFIATSEGLRDSSNLANEYLILKFEGKTANQLYDATNRFCQKNYTNPKNSLKSDIKNEYLKIGTYASSFIQLQKGMFGEAYTGNILFSACFSFKDGKVKFEISEVDMTAWDGEHKVFYTSPGGLNWSIFKSNGKPRGELPTQYQTYFNKYVATYVWFINNEKKNNDNW